MIDRELLAKNKKYIKTKITIPNKKEGAK